MKHLFITGGHGEIGQSIVAHFTGNGYTVTAPRSGEMDCSEPASIKSFVGNFPGPRVSAFVHCAGINNPKPFTDVSNETMLRTIQVNTLSFLYVTQLLDQHFVAGARIAAISSIYGSISRKGRIEYATAKHGLMGMVQTLALELAHRDILVNAVSPGFIETKLTFKNNSPETIEKLISQVPLKKLGRPEQVAELVYFLCSEKNNFITGQDIIIDGGYLAGGFQP